MAQLSETGRDIGPIPKIMHPRCRKRAVKEFRYFCEHYFPETFHLPWSPDHLKVIAKIEEAALRGGLFALAMPRGSGKTSLCETACLWAILIGARRFVALIGSDEGHAMAMLDSMKTELECNDLLMADFPESIHPVRCLEGIANRCRGQLFEGRRTHMDWTAKFIVLAHLPKERLKKLGFSEQTGCGAIIKVAGITGRVRGMKHKRPDGEPVRPDLVIADDPQTDESARSVSQCNTRTRILAGAVLGLAGPGKKISGIMPCTVICPGDMADRILDRDQHPQWQGERTKMVYEFPTSQKLWDEYGEIRAQSLRAGGRGEQATEFYRKHREEMDKGAKVAWPERYNPDELSAIQHAMNLRLQDEAAFFAEYQNEPVIEEESGRGQMLTVDEIGGKLNNRPRAQVPVAANTVTGFVDIQAKVLFYAVCAWENDFTGYVLDYGTYPDQRMHHFTTRGIQRTLRRAHQGAGVEGAIYAGLEVLTGNLLAREWQREDGTIMRIELCLVDAGWGQSTDIVYQFCRQSSHAAQLMPSHGQGITASQRPITEYKRGKGDTIGHHWWIPSVKGQRVLRHVQMDANYWKSFVHQRLATAMGDKGCLSLWGEKPGVHRLFAEHLTAEYFVITAGRGRTVDEWKQPAHKPDNHWLDCLVGCAAAASMRGVSLPGLPESTAVRTDRKRLRLSDLQKASRGL